MLMKMHSCMATNDYLKHVSQQSTEFITNSAMQRPASEGGWEKAISEAIIRREALERETGADLSPGTSISSIPTPELSDGMSSSYVQVHTTTAPRNRLIHTTEPTSIPDDKPKDLTPLAPVYHPDPEISALAMEYLELESELVSSGPERLRWPEKITFKNFAVYQLIPTLVYELDFPRTSKYALVNARGRRPLIILLESVPYMCSKRRLRPFVLSLCFTQLRKRSFYHTRIQILSSPSRGHCWT